MFCFKIIFLIILFLYRKEKSAIDNQLVISAYFLKMLKTGVKNFVKKYKNFQKNSQIFIKQSFFNFNENY